MYVHSSAWQTLYCQPFSSTSLYLRTKSSSLSIFYFFWAVSRRYAAAMFDFTRLLILFRVYIIYTWAISGLPARFFLSTGLFMEIWVLSLSFKFCNNTSPPYMNDVFKPAGQPNTTTRASLLKLNHPLRKTNHGQNNISYIVPIIWNNLPNSLKTTGNLNTYKRKS